MANYAGNYTTTERQPRLETMPGWASTALVVAQSVAWAALLLANPGQLRELVLSSELVLVVLLAGLAASFRPLGSSTLGLGALALPGVGRSFGLGAVVLSTLLVTTLAQSVRRASRSQSLDAPERRGYRRWWSEITRAGLAVSAATAVLLYLPPAWTSWSGALSLVTLLVALILFDRLEAWTATGRWSFSNSWWLTWDGAGWLVGLATMTLAEFSGWGRTLPLIGAITVLALLLTAAMRRAARLERRVHDLEGVSSAARRIEPANRREGDLIVNVVAEVGRAVRYDWLQLELRSERAAVQRFWSRRDALGSGEVHQGAASPPAYPPPEPGIHRRRPWVLLERPLEVNGRLLGHLTLWCDPRRHDPEQLEVLDRLTPQISGSIERARLEREARSDPLTGLPRRSMFDERLSALFMESRETGKPVALIMCDIDHFKRVNDTYGHLTGDQALVRVAQQLGETLRDSDLCCRYGGEEFAVLLAGTDGWEALQSADRLRRIVAASPMHVEGATLELTVSLGVASIPELLVETPNDLVELADRALYAAKDSGRNCALLAIDPTRFRSPSGQIQGSRRGQMEIPLL